MGLSQSFITWLFKLSLTWQVPDHIPITSLLDDAELEDIQLFSEKFLLADDPSDDLTLDD